MLLFAGLHHTLMRCWGKGWDAEPGTLKKAMCG